ncbi:hypothetical protein MUP38_04470 [Candidatus Bathyarchaeota archaeon]|nr:hypothetical protein [Candidatus Bathyarchaeota archaeon]
MSKTTKGKKVFIPPELYQKLAEHAKQKGITVDQEANELLELAIKVLGVHAAAKGIMKGSDSEL